MPAARVTNCTGAAVGSFAHIADPLRRILSGCDVREHAYVVAIVLLQVAESLGVVATIYVVALGSRALGLALTPALAILFAARRAFTALLARRVRLRLIERATSAVLGADMTRASLLPNDDAIITVFEGLHLAERSIVDSLPGIAASFATSVILGVVIAWTASASLLFTGALAIVFGAAVVLVSRQVISRYSAAAAHASSRVYGALAGAVNGRVDLVANGRDAAFLAALSADARRWSDLAMRADRISALAGRAPILAAALAVAVVVGVDSSLRGEVLATGLARSAIYASTVPPFLALARWAMQLAKDAVKLRALVEILDAARSPTGGAVGTPLPPLPSDVAWRGVRFHYGTDAKAVLALDDVSVTWPSGKSLLVVGPNGSGKSTLLRLLLGLFAPSAGSVTVGGVDVLSLDLREWRRSAAYLGQRPYILDRASVRETIAVMAPRADDATMKHALERLAVWSDLARKSPDDPLSASVGALSVGQRQRVVVARVLAQDAPLVVLDEPDANLDAAGVKIVAEVVRELARDRMVVVAAHTPELAAAGDVIVELDMGRVRRSATRSGDDGRHDHA